MDFNEFFDFFSQHGLLFLFIIVALEYMNFPGLPAGIVMPAAGILISESELNIFVALSVSVIAGLIGSMVLYILGYFCEKLIFTRIKSKKFLSFIERSNTFIIEKGAYGVFLCRLTPVLRTIVSIPAGMFKMKLSKFIFWSILGITCWNLALILSGYFFGHLLL